MIYIDWKFSDFPKCDCLEKRNKNRTLIYINLMINSNNRETKFLFAIETSAWEKNKYHHRQFL